MSMVVMGEKFIGSAELKNWTFVPTAGVTMK
jgi:hypothetical protein